MAGADVIVETDFDYPMRNIYQIRIRCLIYFGQAAMERWKKRLWPWLIIIYQLRHIKDLAKLLTLWKR